VSILASPSAAWLAARFGVAPWRFSGNVYGALLNHRDSLVALGDAVAEAPYRGAPAGVVLQLKPRHSLVAGPGAVVRVGDGASELEVRATVGLVIGRTACAVAEGDALAHVAGYVLVADCVVPHAGHFRPQIRAMARDASCVIAVAVAPRRDGDRVDAISLRVLVDGAFVHASSTADHVRSAARLVAEVSDFMTLVPGDVLLTGSAPGAPRIRAGARVTVEGEGLGRLELAVAGDERAVA
jgi:5-oxopent-3-ene-1,2,5-tricarboxylate decarboxylase/2-hydroxyhepta-2,4-diene-1,7-dioate isomerase